jgi:hypothetical protein
MRDYLLRRQNAPGGFCKDCAFAFDGGNAWGTYCLNYSISRGKVFKIDLKTSGCNGWIKEQR